MKMIFNYMSALCTLLLVPNPEPHPSPSHSFCFLIQKSALCVHVLCVLYGNVVYVLYICRVWAMISAVLVCKLATGRHWGAFLALCLILLRQSLSEPGVRQG